MLNMGNTEKVVFLKLKADFILGTSTIKCIKVPLFPNSENNQSNPVYKARIIDNKPMMSSCYL